jgi:hypothetical protein
MDSKYFLLFKTDQAEFKAWNALTAQAKSNIHPIVELTRGKRKPRAKRDFPEDQWPTTPDIYGFNNNLANVRESFKESSNIIIDLTREETLTCHEIDDLSSSKDGYKNWIDFLKIEKRNFQNLIPTLLINPSEKESDEEYKINITNQLDSLMNDFSGVAYRSSVLLDADFIYDFILLKEKINRYLEEGKQFWIELDFEYIPPGMGILHAAQALGLIDRISQIVPRANFIILSTSFPKSVVDIGDRNNDTFPLEEVFLYEEIIKNKGLT